MAKIIPFPESRERDQLELDKIIDQSIKVDDPDLKTCIKQGLTDTMSRYKGIPSFEFHVPLDLTDEEINVLSQSLAEQYNEHVTTYAYSLISEICRLEIELCQLKGQCKIPK